MKEANTALRELETLFQAYPDESTSTLVTRWADGLRTEYQSKVQASQDMQSWQASERYYGICSTQLRREPGNRMIRSVIQEYRIKPDELAIWCKERGLNERHIEAVAMGEEEVYKGYVQAPMRHYSMGKKYQPVPRRDFGDDVPDRPVGKKVKLFGHSLPTGVIPE